jgi:hypothetical protein
VRHRVPGPDVELRTYPQCGGNVFPCWRIEVNPVRCKTSTHHLELVIDRNGEIPESDIRSKVQCVTADNPGPTG